MNQERVPVTLGGRTFEFELCSRSLDFTDVSGPKVTYFWMDGRQLRSGGGPNYHACVDLWWACMAAEGLTVEQANHSDDERDQVACNQTNLVLASLYPLVSGTKGTQKVVRDAWPRRRFWDSVADRYSLEPMEARRLRALAKTRDVSAIGREIRQVLVGEMPPEKERPRYNEALRRWVGNAIVALRRGGRRQMDAFLKEELLPWLQKYCRRGDQKAGSGRARLFINMVAYEARLAFFTCVTNAWGSLIPWLREHRNLEPASEHLLEIMHNQNSRDNGQDVLWGQILSIHPSSAWLFESPDHRAVLGRYLGSVAKHRAGVTIDNAANLEYWAFVGATLIAFREYREQLKVDEAARVRAPGRRARPKNNASHRKKEAALEGGLFEDFATTNGLRCGSCAGVELIFKQQVLHDVSTKQLRVTYGCAECGETHVEIVSADELRVAADEKDRKL